MQKITIGVEGMMCGHCENRVNDTIRKAFDVKKVTSSRDDKQTVVIAEDSIDPMKVRDAVEELGYTILSCKSEPYEKKGLFGLF